MALTWMNKVASEKLAPTKSIIGILRQNLRGYRKARSHETVHASDITKEDFCPRQVALLHLHEKEKKDEFIGTALQATFDIGNAVGDMVPEQWAGDAAIGNWECLRCGDRATFTTKPKKVCKHGGWCHFKYEEVNFISKQYDVSGGIDVFFDLGGLKKVVTELKIINVADFDKIVAPLAEHRIRTAMYLKLIDDSSHPFKSSINVNEGRVLYVSRGFGKKNTDHAGEILPFKEYVVTRDDAAVQPYLDKAMAVKVFKETGVVPKGICKSLDDKACKKCAVVSECWAHEAED